MSKPSKPNNIAASPSAETTFIARVIPWPKDGEPGYCNLHWTVPDKAGMRGRACSRIEDFMGMARWGAAKPGAVKDIYFCLSSQKTTGKVINGNATALRNAHNVLALKSLWMDIDVKPEKGYATINDAIDALTAFRQAANLPPPTAIVLSGSGVHVYWISDKPLTVEEWRPYAEGLEALAKTHGLKRDPGLTTDSVRILRVPGTFNYKTTPPKGVRLAGLSPADLNFEKTLGHLRVAPSAVSGPITKQVDLLYDPKLFPLRALPQTHGIDSLAAGIHANDDTPLDYAEVIKNCPHFRETARTHGAGTEQGLWMLDVLAMHVHAGRPQTRALSSAAVTRRTRRVKPTRCSIAKVPERAERGLGWPSCSAFESAGCKECAGCPFKGKIRSPLNLAARVAPPATAFS